MSEDYYVDGKEHGISKTWYENGQLKSEITYKFGKYDGNLTLWKNNGQLELKAEYKNGQLINIPYMKKDSLKINKDIPVF